MSTATSKNPRKNTSTKEPASHDTTGEDATPAGASTQVEGEPVHDTRPLWDRLVDHPGLWGRVRRQWPWTTVLLIVAVGLILIAVGLWRIGAGVIGLGMVTAGVLRLILPQAGIIEMRTKRWVDLVFYFAVGLSLLALAVLRGPTP
jgi:hypothetical protein